MAIVKQCNQCGKAFEPPGSRSHCSVVCRYWSKVQKGPGCWSWMGSRSTAGYGTFNIGAGRFGLSHRLAWEFSHAHIQDGLQVLHRCDNPSCCNPEHLFLGTPVDNMQDMSKKRRHGSVVKPHRVASGARHGSVTHPESLARGERHGSKTHPESVQKGSRQYLSKLSEAAVIEMRRARRLGETYNSLAIRFGVSSSSAFAAICGVTWRHVDEPPVDPCR